MTSDKRGEGEAPAPWKVLWERARGSASGEAAHAPSTLRNRAPILAVLRRVLPPDGLVLEVASGTGEHAVFFAAAFPDLNWQCSDPDPDSRASIAAHAGAAGLANLPPPLDLDVTAPRWPLARADALVCINMLHIAPWAAGEALIRGAGRLLPPGAPLYLYGPYKRGGVHTAPSNAAFDESLRARNATWGLRGIEQVADCARRVGFGAPEVVEMPSHNFSLIFRRRRTSGAP